MTASFDTFLKWLGVGSVVGFIVGAVFAFIDPGVGIPMMWISFFICLFVGLLERAKTDPW